MSVYFLFISSGLVVFLRISNRAFGARRDMLETSLSRGDLSKHSFTSPINLTKNTVPYRAL